MSVRIGNSIVAGMSGKVLHSIGEIFTTTDTGVIAGAVEANGGSYNLADYNSGKDSIASKLAAGTLPYVSKTEFQTRVANTGACDSFGWNGVGETYYAWTASSVSVTRAANPVSQDTYYTLSATPAVGDNLYYAAGSVDAAKIVEVASDYSYIVTDLDEGYYNHIRDTSKDIVGTTDTTFLVPKLNSWHVGKSAPVIGNGMTVGMTDGTNNFSLWNSNSAGAPIQGYVGLYGQPVGSTNPGAANQVNKGVGITTDPAKSGMITDLSETTNLRVMVQLATGVTDQALETCTSVLSDVSALKYDYVVDFQAPTATNNYTWYRKYKSGWIEQGGEITATSVADGTGTSGNNLITLPVPMVNTHYHINLQAQVGSSGWDYANGVILQSRSTTNLTVKVVAGNGSFPLFWQISGMVQ